MKKQICANDYYSNVCILLGVMPPCCDRSSAGDADDAGSVVDNQSLDANTMGRSGPMIREPDNTEPSVTELLKGISGDIKQLNGRITGLERNLDTKHQSLSDRIDQLESSLEKKLSNRMAQIMDKRFNSEMRKLQKEIDTRVGDIRADLQSDVRELAAKVDSVSESVNSGERASDVVLNIVIRDLPEREGENTLAKVNNLLKDNLKLRDVVACSADRKSSPNAKPGVVVATLESVEDKKKVLKAKSLLRNTSMSKVFIHPDQSRSERLQHANLRALVDAINGGGRDISVRGNRVVRERPTGRDSRPAPRSERGDNSDRQPRNRYDTDRERSNGRDDNRSQRSLFRDNRSQRDGARGTGRSYARVTRRN